jgi:hypothetical protein
MILDDEDILIKDIPISNLDTLIECLKETRPRDISVPESLRIFMESKFRDIEDFKWAYSFGSVMFSYKLEMTSSSHVLGSITYGVIGYKDGRTLMQLVVFVEEQGKIIFDILGVDDKDIKHYPRVGSHQFSRIFDI